APRLNLPTATNHAVAAAGANAWTLPPRAPVRQPWLQCLQFRSPWKRGSGCSRRRTPGWTPEFQRARRSISRTPECEAGLERNAGNQRAGALTDGSQVRSDGAEAAAVQALVGAGSERGGSGRKVPQVNRSGLARRNRVLNPVENIRELR